MKAFILVFDYNILKTSNLTELHEAIKKDSSITAWWHHLKGTYLLITKPHVTAENIRAFFHQYFPKEHCLIMQVNAPADYSGWLDKEAWNWFQNTFIKVH